MLRITAESEPKKRALAPDGLIPWRSGADEMRGP
jgi:hypothetical protein